MVNVFAAHLFHLTPTQVMHFLDLCYLEGGSLNLKHGNSGTAFSPKLLKPPPAAQGWTAISF